jgi:hypothetical protein
VGDCQELRSQRLLLRCWKPEERVPCAALNADLDHPRDDFDHPHVPGDSALRRHVLYRVRPSDLRQDAQQAHPHGQHA